MKKLLSIFLLFIALQSMAQGNLQFNQVINIKNGDTYTVPAGKVLKITSVNNSPTATKKIPFSRCVYYQGQYSPLQWCIYDQSNVILGNIGNMVFTLSAPGQNSYDVYGEKYSQCSECPSFYDYTGGFSISISTPLWLKAGQNININPGSGTLISAIEFNIVP